MALTLTRRVCGKCNKGAGTAMCYGCEQAFCTKHFLEHRQDLSQQMEYIGQEHDVIQRDLTHEQDTHFLITRINQWEQESITKIQIAAQSARTNLQQLLNRPKNNLQTSVSKITEELQSSRELDDYTELDIKRWTDQLQEFRKILDAPISVNIDYEKDSRSAVRLIKINDQQSLDSLYQTSQVPEYNDWISHSSDTFLSERFDDIFGKVILSEGGLVATCAGGHADRSCVCGTSRYSVGVHYIHFRIEQTSTHYHSFFGIINSSEKMTFDIWNSSSFNGWWDLDYSVISGKSNRRLSPETIRMGDDVTLMLDCINRRIQLEHHRTNRTVTMSIDIQLCPFPWKIIVLLLGKDDCVRILQ
ncbi:unnamed protein product [Adineta steineri]|uniref:B box-type domain-containing protein n=1 Tax=Adineta steineri TaxID=433720 RepID=A0A814C025_9BILA|nr:unnamed protein product [Adineta steineri]CAF0990850.1 unnamed protein product [Adineta steineri]CAF3545912.1 unnamed protein product [Adineta steineri]CAF3835211.1 unnamed protein product [Adineta steineri]